ncbi:RNA polymerase sigma-70 factor, ECF subfamily [Actinopolyspora mzabensis]|uniref:RNA polymerase sigma factor n=2 Tax=Actinopolyspora mzabensis TaxID=995066 RepID=A0A1G8Y5G9_ACTMZ|nr:RNA polymerase sigma-70 factor, ECF subfamily [Actinopolyspora mzabensis]
MVHKLISDIESRVGKLTPKAPTEFYSDVTELAGVVGKLRRLARSARDAAQKLEFGTGEVNTAEHNSESVTHQAVTESLPGDITLRTSGDERTTAVSIADADEWTFAGMVEPHRRELQVHCYRLVGSYDDSEDLVQETYLRAWRSKQDFEGRSTFRAWLYRIATNICLDFLRRNSRRPQRYEPMGGSDAGDVTPPSKVTWLQPYPDELLTEAVAQDEQPDNAVETRETMELVFLVAIQHLPPLQRAVFLLRDVLGWTASDTAHLLDTSTASVNSALQRARPTLREHLPRRRSEWNGATAVSETERDVLQRYMLAAERGDADTISSLLSEDVVLTMPPNPMWFIGREAMMSFIRPSTDPTSPHYLGRWKHRPTFANRQPASAGYLQRPGTTVYRAQVLDVLRIQDGKIVEITSFEPHLFPAFGLSMTL